MWSFLIVIAAVVVLRVVLRVRAEKKRDRKSEPLPYFVSPSPMELPDRIHKLSLHLQPALHRIEPSFSWSGEKHYPCQVELDDGTVLPRVLVTDAVSFFQARGIWPWDESGGNWVPVERIRNLSESPLRLPARFANTISAAGETGMGYHAFVVELFDKTLLNFVIGGTVDFPDWPPDVHPLDAVRVHVHRMPRRTDDASSFRGSADFVWALKR